MSTCTSAVASIKLLCRASSNRCLAELTTLATAASTTTTTTFPRELNLVKLVLAVKYHLS